MLYVAAAHAVKVARRDHVQRHGDDAHGVLRERQQIEPRKARGVELHVPQYRRALLERGDRRVPEPRVLVRGLQAARALQLVRARGEALREVQVLKERGERLGVLRGGVRLA